jgi:alcohol dehydrogenase (cytochrome c)
MSRDVWDMDWAFEQSLIDLPIDNVERRLLVTGGKMALFDAVDRTNGHYEFSRDAGLQNIVATINKNTGEKAVSVALTPVVGEKKLVCPGPSGLRNWPATSYNPSTYILYVPMVEACADFTWLPRDAAQTAAGGIDQKFQMRPMPQSDGNFGRIQAINLQSGKTVWTIRQRAPISSAMLASAGGIAFNGSRDRYFRAYDQSNGKVLWETRLGAAPSSFPITYTVNAIQYVAVVAGGGNPLDTQLDPLTPEIVNPTVGTTLWVFQLPGK